MDSDSKKKSPYGAAMIEDWESMIDHYKSDPSKLLDPVTSDDDTALHVAVCSKTEQPLKDLLALLRSIDHQENLLRSQNNYGNTILHAATIYGNFEAVKLLVDRCPDLVSIPNNYSETPLFTAAEFADPEVVKFLLVSLSKEIVDEDGCLKPIHRQRTYLDNPSILSAAIIGQHYDTALMLLELDESLRSLKDKNGITALQFLANSPSAFKSGYPMEMHERLLYNCLPVTPPHKVKKSQEETSGQARQGLGDLESGSGRTPRGCLLSCLNDFIKEYWPAWLRRLWDEKKKHVLALRLAENLIKQEESWNPDKRPKYGPEGQTSADQSSDASTTDIEQGDQKIVFQSKEIEVVLRRPAQTSATKPLLTRKEKPLFIAARQGIEEVVSVILEQHPQAIEQLDDDWRSILDEAVMHRKNEIFSFVKRKKVPLARLGLNIDKEGNTLLHQVADMKHYSGGTRPGPALQLQEEMQWFERVKKVIPSHYATLPNNKGDTAKELFKKNHKKQLQKAQKWIKETAQSCSTVAALVATVVFAAAYTVPGGSDEKGTPNFIKSPYFLVFTASDVVSLASSLTSLVVFLSLLTSPFEQEDFRVSLPRKLIIGFTFLFFSVMTTMLSFGATILILIQSEKKLTTLLLSIAAFLPVFVFVIMQFHLYVSLMGSTINFFDITKRALPSRLVRRLPGGKKHF